MEQRLLTLLALMLCVCSGAWADDTYTASFESSDWSQSTTNYFSSVGTKNNPNANYSGKYNGTSYSKGLKMESDTKVQFTTTRTFDITIIRSTAKNSDKTISFGTSEGTKTELTFGEALSDANNENVAVATLTDQAAGTYQIVRGNGEAGIVYVSVTEKGTSTTPILTLGANSTSIRATESGTEVTEEISVTGTNLTGTALTATLNPAVTGLSVSLGTSSITDGSISTNATLHYSQTENASGSTTLTISDGTTSKDVTINYKALVNPTELVAISSTEITTFELKNTGENLQTVTAEDYVVLTDAGSEASYSDNLAVKGVSTLNVTWRSDAVQAGYFKFKTTVPGSVTVKFSDTGGTQGGDRAPRYANVNGTRSDVSSNGSSGGVVTCSPITVEAGEVVIKGEQYNSGDENYTDNQIRVFTITFTPTIAKTITSAGWATFCSSSIVDPSGVEGLTAYIVTGGADGKLTKTPVTGAVPANTGLLLKGAQGTYYIPVAASSTFDVTSNKLIGVTEETTLDLDSNDDDVADSYIYVLMYYANALNFYKTSSTSFTLGANTAYLPSDFDNNNEARMTFILEEGTTAIKSVSTSESETQGYYNLAGQRVSQPVKGLYIKDGKKYVVK